MKIKKILIIHIIKNKKSNVNEERDKFRYNMVDKGGEMVTIYLFVFAKLYIVYWHKK